VHPTDVFQQGGVTQFACGRGPGLVLVVRGRGDLQAVLGQHGADRLDTPAQTAVSAGLTAVCVLANELRDQ
jgi:hypothetical protein